jgi:ATP-binding cassette subfamily B protein
MNKITTLPNRLWPFIFHMLRPNRRRFFTVVILVSIATAQFAFQPYLAGLVIDGLQEAAQIGKPLFEHVTPILIIMTVMMIIGAICRRAAAFVNNRYERDLSHYALMQVYDYTAEHAVEYFDSDFAGRIGTKMLDVPRNLREFSGRFIHLGLTIVITFIVAFALMGSMQVSFLILLSCWLALWLGSTIWTSIHVRALSNNVQECHSRMSGRLVDIVSNMRLIASFARTGYERTGFESKVDDLDAAFIKEEDFIARFYVVQAISFVSLILGTIILGAYAHAEGWITIGELAAIIPLSLLIGESSWGLSEAMIYMYHNLGTIDNAIATLIKPHDVVDTEKAKPLKISESRLSFENITFSYGGQADVFNGLSVEIAPGSRVGLVGASGSGKSTFIKLLLRFYDLEGGNILIDGQNIATVTQDSLRHEIAMIPQDTTLFHRSLMENIRYGRLEASDEEVLKAAKQAHAHDFIETLPNTYQTLVGERGIKLSGGQRQRIAIARAILKNAPILVLDEATSALDSISEQHIQEDLHTLMQGRTVIAIAHRLSTLADMDRILVFDQGKIVEDGSHEGLIKADGHYAKLWHSQVGGFLP